MTANLFIGCRRFVEDKKNIEAKDVSSTLANLLAKSVGLANTNVSDNVHHPLTTLHLKTHFGLFQAVLNATTNVKPLPAALLPQPVFYPTVDNVTVFVDYRALSVAGLFAKIVSLYLNFYFLT